MDSGTPQINNDIQFQLQNSEFIFSESASSDDSIFPAILQAEAATDPSVTACVGVPENMEGCLSNQETEESSTDQEESEQIFNRTVQISMNEWRDLVENMTILQNCVSELLNSLGYSYRALQPNVLESAGENRSSESGSGNEKYEGSISEPSTVYTSATEELNLQFSTDLEEESSDERDVVYSRSSPEMNDKRWMPQNVSNHRYASSLHEVLVPTHFTLPTNSTSALEGDTSTDQWDHDDLLFDRLCSFGEFSSIRSNPMAASTEDDDGDDSCAEIYVPSDLSLSDSERKLANANKLFVMPAPQTKNKLQERPSIQNLRAKNAGLVMQRTKFFDALEGNSVSQTLPEDLSSARSKVQRFLNARTTPQSPASDGNEPEEQKRIFFGG